MMISMASPKGAKRSPKGAKSARQADHACDSVHLRLHNEGEGEGCYCTLSTYEHDGECGSWNTLHAGCLEAWDGGHGKAKGGEKVQLEQSIFSSLHNLVVQDKVALPVSPDQGAVDLLRGVRVLVLLKTSAISRGALSATVLENLHDNRKYANDIRNVMSLLQPSLVDMGAQVRACQSSVGALPALTQEPGTPCLQVCVSSSRR